MIKLQNKLIKKLQIDKNLFLKTIKIIKKITCKNKIKRL